MSIDDKISPIRLATDDEVNELCAKVATIACVSDIPVLNPNVYFTLGQIIRIYRVRNQFQESLNRFFEKLEYGCKKDHDTFISLVKSHVVCAPFSGRAELSFNGSGSVVLECTIHYPPEKVQIGASDYIQWNSDTISVIR